MALGHCRSPPYNVGVGVYPGFLLALFMTSGVTTVRVAANPLATSTGDPLRAGKPFDPAQAFYSPGDHYWADFWCIIYSGQRSCCSRREQIISAGTGNDDGKRAGSRLSIAFLIIATPLIVMAIVCWSGRHWVKDRTPSLAKKGHAALLSKRRLRFVVASIFLYVDAAVTIGGGMANTSGWTAHCPRQHKRRAH
jgi:fucose permease